MNDPVKKGFLGTGVDNTTGFMVLSSLFKIGGSVIQGMLQKGEIESARKEARQLFNQSRADKLAQNSRVNQLNRDKMSLAESQTTTDVGMFEREKRARQADTAYDIKTTGRKTLGESAKNILGANQDFLNIRGRLAARG
jgi:hypothetical protein